MCSDHSINLMKEVKNRGGATHGYHCEVWEDKNCRHALRHTWRQFLGFLTVALTAFGKGVGVICLVGKSAGREMMEDIHSERSRGTSDDRQINQADCKYGHCVGGS